MTTTQQDRLDAAMEAMARPQRVAAAIGIPLAKWANRCHEVSHAIVRGGLLGEPGPFTRVARGVHPEIGVHSWIALCPAPKFGEDVPGVYRDDAVYVDPTCAFTLTEEGKWAGTARITVSQAFHSPHLPAGFGDILEIGVPPRAKRNAVLLTPEKPLSARTQFCLDALLGPLDRRGWNSLFAGPMCGWPAPEIITAALQTVELAALVPMDVQGMVTDLNPQGLYW